MIDSHEMTRRLAISEAAPATRLSPNSGNPRGIGSICDAGPWLQAVRGNWPQAVFVAALLAASLLLTEVQARADDQRAQAEAERLRLEKLYQNDVYTLTLKHGGKFLTACDEKMANDLNAAHIRIHTPDIHQIYGFNHWDVFQTHEIAADGSWENPDLQHWLIIPAPNPGTVYLITTATGRFLQMGYTKDTSAWAQTSPYADPNDVDASSGHAPGLNQMWTIRTTNDGHITLQNAYSGHYLTARNGAMDDNAKENWVPILQNSAGQTTGGKQCNDCQKWKLTSCRHLQLPQLDTVVTFPATYPKMTKEALQHGSEEYVTAAERLPFFMVKHETADWQAKNSPYYTLTARNKWACIDHQENGTDEKNQMTARTTVDHNTKSVNEIEKSLNLTVTAHYNQTIGASIASHADVGVEVKAQAGISGKDTNETENRLQKYSETIKYLDAHKRVVFWDVETSFEVRSMSQSPTIPGAVVSKPVIVRDGPYPDWAPYGDAKVPEKPAAGDTTTQSF